jgi:hypothetical protein
MREIPLGLAAPDHTVPYGTVLSGALFQALRARTAPPGQQVLLASSESPLL